MQSLVGVSTQQYFGFDPRTLGNVLVWCDASRQTSVTSWMNLGTGGTILCSGSVLVANRNGNNVVRLTNAQSWTMQTAATPSAYTLFWSGRQTGGTNGRVLQGASGNQLFGYWAGYKRSLYIDGSPANHVTSWGADTTWDIMSHSRTAGGPYTFNWNGTSIYSGTTSAGGGLGGLAINSGPYGSETSACEIGEIILYDFVLTPAQIQQVEGYLAWKWGVNASLPIGHLLYNRPPVMRNFQPTDVSGCQLWLDGADLKTFSFSSGSNISQWRDKSGNMYHANQSTVGNQPTRTNGTVRFNGATAANFLDISTLTIGGSTTSIFFVIQNTGPPSGNASEPHFLWPINDTGGNTLSMNRWIIVSIQNTNNNISTTLLKDQNYVVSYTFGVTSNFEQLYANGTSLGTYQKASPYSSTPYRIGSINGSQTVYNLDGTISEILVYNMALNTSQRQQVEGYLASKWGLSSLLPTTQPYFNKRALPSTLAFSG